MKRFLRLSSSLALCALLAVPAAAGAARDDFDLSASGISSSGYAQQLGAPKSMWISSSDDIKALQYIAGDENVRGV